MIVFFSVFLFFPLFVFSLPGQVSSITHTTFVEKPTVERRGQQVVLSLPNAFYQSEPGMPLLPLLTVLLPVTSGWEVTSCTVEGDDGYSFLLPADLAWAQPPQSPSFPIESSQPANAACYASFDNYPASRLVRTEMIRERDAAWLACTFSPFQYQPARRILYGARRFRIQATLRQCVIPRLTSSSLSTLPFQSASYLILSTSNLLARTEAPYGFQALRDAREARGLSTASVSVEWIDAHYGQANRALRIRSFMKDAYEQWGVRYLLLAGTFDEIPALLFTNRVPRSTSVEYATLTPSDSISFGCLDGSMDGNGNGIYGELADGDGGNDIDLSPEVMVGRFPVSTPEEVSWMVRKTLLYEAMPKEEGNRHLFVGERVDYDPYVYADPFLDQIRFGGQGAGAITGGFTNSPYGGIFQTHTLYDGPGQTWTKADLFSSLNEGAHTVHFFGHSSTYQSMKVSVPVSGDPNPFAALENPNPFLLFSQACSSGSYDKQNCWAEQLVTAPMAAVSAVAFSREAWTSSDFNMACALYFARLFWESAFDFKASTVGEMFTESRRLAIPKASGFYGVWRATFFAMQLFGDPALCFFPKGNVMPLEITHTPLQNTTNVVDAYSVAFSLSPGGLYQQESAHLVWRSSADPSICHTQQVSRSGTGGFVSQIPPQPRFTTVAYAIFAQNEAGIVSRSPMEGFYRFCVTKPNSLVIAGSPDEVGAPSPDYGIHSFPSGVTVRAIAPAPVSLSDGVRIEFNQFVGSGDVPSAGTTNECLFPLHRAVSSLVWLGTRLARTQFVWGGDLSPSLSWNPLGDEISFSAPEQVTNLCFCGWYRDGSRDPAAPAYAPSKMVRTVDAPHVYTARYLPETQDADLNGLPDWYEVRYYGETGQDPASDEDGDGFSLLQEYLYLTDPLSVDSCPLPPEIHYTPLAQTVTSAPPYTLIVEIPQMCPPITASLCWSLGNAPEQPEQTVPLTDLGGGRYSVSFAEGTNPGDLIHYSLQAKNREGVTSTTSVETAFLSFPKLNRATLRPWYSVVDPTTNLFEAMSCSAYLLNEGNQPLVGRFCLAWEDPVTERTLREWRLGTETSNVWTLATNRFVSSVSSLHAQLVSTPRKPSYARITTPAFRIGSSACLSFDSWMCGEMDKEDPTRAYDGGIVEFAIGTNDFQQLRGPYSHTIYGWARSPWPDGTPCFSGTGGWQRIVFDLASLYPAENGWRGQTIRFRFSMGGDDNSDPEGWYIDNIHVSPLAEGLAVDSPQGDFTIPSGGMLPIEATVYPAYLDSIQRNWRVSWVCNDPTGLSGGIDWFIRLWTGPPQLRMHASADNAFFFSWNSILGCTYGMESTTNLFLPDWIPETEWEMGNDAEMRFSLPVSAPSQYFRIRVNRP